MKSTYDNGRAKKPSLGQMGVAITSLRQVGVAKFGNLTFDVMSRYGVIPIKSKVRVIGERMNLLIVDLAE